MFKDTSTASYYRITAHNCGVNNHPVVEGITSTHTTVIGISYTRESTDIYSCHLSRNIYFMIY